MMRAMAWIFMAAALGNLSCESDGASGGDPGGGGAPADVQNAGATDAADAASAGDAAAAPGSCGPSLTCQPSQACQSLGQGVCGGPAPAADGSCAPGCSAFECGGGKHCMCTSYECIDLPAGCDGCDCTWTDWHKSCSCDDSGGVTLLLCPGA